MASRYRQSMGAKLKALRSQRHFVAKGLADVAGVSTRTWYNWEHAVPIKRIKPAFTALKTCEKKLTGGNQMHLGF